MIGDRKPPALRAATVTDAQSLASMHACAFEDAWDTAAFQGLLSNAGCLAYVAIEVRDGAALGFALGQVAADEAEVLSIAVRPIARRSGLGRDLLSALLHAAAQRGAATMHLEVAADNGAALALYAAAGFIVNGRRKGYYVRSSGRVDALMMSRALA